MERRALEQEREQFEAKKRMELQEEIRERERLRKRWASIISFDI